MRKRTPVLGITVAGVALLALAGLGLMMAGKARSKVSITFVGAELSNGEFPTYNKCQRLNFAVSNAGNKTASVCVTAIEDENGVVTPGSRRSEETKPGQNRQLYSYLPTGVPARSVRFGVMESASLRQKIGLAARLLVQRAKGNPPRMPLWPTGLQVGVGEVVVPVSDYAGDKSTPANKNIFAELEGAWVAEFKYAQGPDATRSVTVASNGNYNAVFSIPRREAGPRTILQRGTWRVEGGYLVDTVGFDSQTNASTPYTNRLPILRLGENELVLGLDDSVGIVNPTNSPTYRRPANP